ncbi:class I SAM-dependent methyltransferase [Alysiella filiformis]|uniref:Methyltransferase domain-containing protein n=1 Tax=Alysiella filiformis DSM 16848 TaxID=1120981 RepID=A0A286EKY9_9NEIS|nr:hypothetical protein [Alysiella filiformis]QMT30967.1 hypothetical protein H3L97_09570 [Alysiella filiformis]UBQ56046.1 hypothetical protein JF568_10900 [Alysiella filiformis DSM 16848]SOD71499.1 hypothetical protein SAMN02746062_02148 [Alysiella filiformis DSM 16848]
MMSIQATHFQNWLQNTDLGQYVIQQERDFFQAAFRGFYAERVLQMGFTRCFAPQNAHALWVQQNHDLPAQIVAESATVWRNNAFDAVMLPHFLELSPEPQRQLFEITRIVQAAGHLVLTGLNPHSLWRFVGDEVPIHQAIDLPKLKSWLPELGWQIVQGRFMNYLPPINSQKAIEKLQFMELAGNRWLPHAAAIYGLVLRKQLTPLRGACDEVDDVLLSGDVALGLTRGKF